MNFTNNYRQLLSETLKRTDSEEKINEMLDKEPDLNKWLEALALCEASVDMGLNIEKTGELYKNLFRHKTYAKFGAALADDDYKEWFDLCNGLHKKMIDAGITRVWSDLSGMYADARFPYRDLAKATEYLEKGIAAGDPECLAMYGSLQFHGSNKFIDRNEEKGLEALNQALSKGYRRAELLIMYAKLEETDKDEADALPARVEQYGLETGDNKNTDFIADIYAYKKDDFVTAGKILEEGVRNNDQYAKHRLGLFILRDQVEGSKEKALKLLEEAGDEGVGYSYFYSGQYYNFDNEAKDVEKCIEYYKKAIKYYDSSSMYNLALVYAYEYKDVEKCFEYLDMAIAEGMIAAKSEKAYFLLDSDLVERDAVQAKRLLEEATDEGNVYAPYRLARGYQNAEFGEEQNYQKAFELYNLASDRGYLYATEMVGRYYRAGAVGEPDPENAVKYYNMAIEKNSDYARVEMAICYEDGFGVEKDFGKAEELLQQAADNGYAFANVKLGYYYMNEVNGVTDLDKSFDYFSKAAESNNPDALYNLGRFYKYAIGRPENPEAAMQYFGRAAELGDFDAHVEMALAYENEYGGTEFDADKALEYMAKAAEKNIPYAQYKMGYYLYYGIKEKDKEKGLEWLKKAYENGSPSAALTIGDHYLYSRDDGVDYNDAFQYYKFAEENGYVSEGIGLCYSFGIGVEKNHNEAFKFFGIAADRGYTTAKYRLGMCYKRGKGTAKNPTEAFNWLSQAAEDGNKNAAYEVGMMLLEGSGTAMNIEKGVEMLQQAAEKNQDDAQFELGNCYLTGKGVDEDEVRAMYWYQKAAENGNEQALKITGKRKKRR